MIDPRGTSTPCGRHLQIEPTITSIVDVGNDQGRQVRLTWAGSCGDNASSSPRVTEYGIFRRIDPLPRTYPPGDWDYLKTVPAYFEAEHNTIVPTRADSNDAGIYMTTFFVRAVTTTVGLFYDSGLRLLQAVPRDNG